MTQALAAVGITRGLLVKGIRGLKRSGPKTASAIRQCKFYRTVLLGEIVSLSEQWTALLTALMHWAFRPFASCIQVATGLQLAEAMASSVSDAPSFSCSARQPLSQCR